MSEQTPEYHVYGRTVRRETYLASQRLTEFLIQFDSMTEEEKKECIKRVDQLRPELLIQFYQALQQYIE
ncbi:hypothetical protein [Petroclostridium sp. X23]|uniref:hypothetical protein n=1 Tax=Petroclostridium sp. X23 TaxID=3045146 RepID=UPI0024AE66C8|nr:hypothetical protein [Petroclostridium sp. X23]WHH59189.1 hypothetical protein QKW49_00005 [Petroclostridium sp. X23]